MGGLEGRGGRREQSHWVDVISESRPRWHMRILSNSEENRLLYEAMYRMSKSGLLLGTCTLLRKQHRLDVWQNAPLRNGNAREELA